MTLNLNIKKTFSILFLLNLITLPVIAEQTIDSATPPEEISDNIQERTIGLDKEDGISLDADTDRLDRVTSQKNPEAIENCENIAKQLDSIIIFYDYKNSTFNQRYSNINTNLEILRESLEKDGQEVSELGKSIQGFAGLTNRFQILSTRFMDSLLTAQFSVCSSPEREFLNNKDDFQTGITRLRDKDTEIKEYIQNQLKPEIEKYK